MEELNKLRLKKELFKLNQYFLSVDSLTGEIINPLFEAIDNNKYFMTTKSYQLINDRNHTHNKFAKRTQESKPDHYKKLIETGRISLGVGGY